MSVITNRRANYNILTGQMSIRSCEVTLKVWTDKMNTFECSITSYVQNIESVSIMTPSQLLETLVDLIWEGGFH